MKERILKQALNIMCKQRNIDYKYCAKELKISKSKLLEIVNAEFHIEHERIVNYFLKNIDFEQI